jgi:hypothetical protein
MYWHFVDKEKKEGDTIAFFLTCVKAKLLKNAKVGSPGDDKIYKE